MQVKFINLKEVPNALQLEVRNWRNSEDVSKWFQIKYINEVTHKEWLKNLYNKNPETIAYLIKDSSIDKFVGFTYFRKINYENRCADWGLYVYPKENRGKGYGHIILDASIKYAKDSLKLKVLYLEVLKENKKAINIYEKFNFKQIDKTENIYKYKLIL